MLRVEEPENRSLFRVVRLRRVSGRWADAAVLLTDQLVVGKLFALTKPPFAACLGMQPFGKRLGNPVSQGLNKDRVVIVVLTVETGGKLVGANAGRDGKRTDIVLAA